MNIMATGHSDAVMVLSVPEQTLQLRVHRMEGNSHMNATSKRTLGMVLGVVPSLLMPVSSAIADNTTTGDGMMGNGSMYGGSGMWLTTLIVVGLAIALFAALGKTK